MKIKVDFVDEDANIINKNKHKKTTFVKKRHQAEIMKIETLLSSRSVKHGDVIPGLLINAFPNYPASSEITRYCFIECPIYMFDGLQVLSFKKTRFMTNTEFDLIIINNIFIEV